MSDGCDCGIVSSRGLQLSLKLSFIAVSGRKGPLLARSRGGRKPSILNDCTARRGSEPPGRSSRRRSKSVQTGHARPTAGPRSRLSRAETLRDSSCRTNVSSSNGAQRSRSGHGLPLKLAPFGDGPVLEAARAAEADSCSEREGEHRFLGAAFRAGGPEELSGTGMTRSMMT